MSEHQIERATQKWLCRTGFIDASEKAYARNRCGVRVSNSVQLNVQLACICVQLAWRPPPITPACCTRLRAPLRGANRCLARNGLRSRDHGAPSGASDAPCAASLLSKACLSAIKGITPKMPFRPGCSANPSGATGRRRARYSRSNINKILPKMRLKSRNYNGYTPKVATCYSANSNYSVRPTRFRLFLRRPSSILLMRSS